MQYRLVLYSMYIKLLENIFPFLRIDFPFLTTRVRVHMEYFMRDDVKSFFVSFAHLQWTMYFGLCVCVWCVVEFSFLCVRRNIYQLFIYTFARWDIAQAHTHTHFCRMVVWFTEGNSTSLQLSCKKKKTLRAAFGTKKNPSHKIC